MIKQKLRLVVVLAIVALCANAKGNYVDYVSTLVGSDSNFELSTGNTYPATVMPWGMNFWTPQTGHMGEGWIYSYNANRIRGFKQTHQPSPWMNDYGQFAIMPTTGTPVFREDDRASFFNHKAETARPYYYQVFLADYDINTEIVPTERAAMFRFTFPESNNSSVVIDALDGGSAVKIIPAQRKVVGYTTKNSGGVPGNFKNYFVIVFDKPFTYTAAVPNGEIRTDALEASGNHAGAIIGFATKKGEKVHARVASSFISPEQAELNLKELGNNSFEALKQKGKDRWNEVLGRIEVSSDNLDEMRTFYSCLYRCTLFPRMFFERDAKGQIVHYSPYNGNVEPGYMYTDMGFWDIFRALMPLVDLVYPDVARQMQEGFYNAYKESGFYPEWATPGHRECMVGNNSASVVTDAYMKGLLPKQDLQKIYEALLHDANNVHSTVSTTGRVGYKEYNTLGYVPSDVVGQSASRTLEYAYDDWCIYQMGKSLGRPKAETDVYRQRCQNYKNLFYAKYGMMSGRDSKGNFLDDFKPDAWWGPFTEGNSWHWTWCVFHDIRGLVNLMGGDKAFTDKLDAVFTTPPTFGGNVDTRKQLIHEMREMQVVNMGQYAHGNQPIQHMIYLYNYAGEPWKTQYWAREVMKRLYLPTPDGYCGDEDNGQTSAWYVMSALGFYSVCPGSNQYVLGSPLFKKASIHLPNGKTISMTAAGNSDVNRYVQSLKVNGKEYGKNYLTQEQLANGAALSFQMGDKPNKKRGTQRSSFPYSYSDNNE